MCIEKQVFFYSSKRQHLKMEKPLFASDTQY